MSQDSEVGGVPIEPGKLYIATIGHDEGCPSLETQSGGDCVCEATTADGVEFDPEGQGLG